MLNHKGSLNLETERLILRPFKEEDAKKMYDGWTTDTIVTRYVTWTPHESLEETKKLIKLWMEENKSKENYHWIIEGKEEKIVIGTIGLFGVDNKNENCEIGYCIRRDYWNKGITTEAAKRVLEYALNEVEFNRVTGRHDIENPASGKVMKKCGLKYEGTLRKIIKNPKGEFVDLKYYSILKDEI